jgi:hypothetical protein
MKTALKGLSALIVVVAAAIQLVRPARTNPAADSSRAIEAALPVPSHVTAILDRSCRDCHSNGTRWPWYSNVAPVSWFVIDHVDHGRSHLNFSDWAAYRPEQRATLLTNICDLTTKGEMPLPSYTIIHRHARLSEADVRALCEWTRSVRNPADAGAER